MLQQSKTRTIRRFLEAAFEMAGLDWERALSSMKPTSAPPRWIHFDEIRRKAIKQLGWKPKTTFDQLVHEMLENDVMLEGLEPANHLRKPPAGVSQ